MAATDDLNSLVTENREFTSSMMCLEHLTSFMDKVYSVDAEIQAIYDSGDYENMPLDVKTAFDAWWNIVKTARDAINANQDILDLYSWRP